MTIPPRQRLFILAGLTGLVLCLAIGWVWLAQIPVIRQARADIDTQRAAITVKQEEQRNFATVKKNLETLEKQQQRLLDEIWSFDAEETFYARWTGIGESSGATCDEPKIADATPGKTIISRAISGTCRGTLNQVTNALNRIQTILPAIILTRITLARGAEGSAVVLTFDAVSLWK